MHVILAMVGSLLAAGGTLPYIVQTVHGTTKPRIVTWLTWSMLTGVAAAAAFAAGDVSSGTFALLGAVATGLIVVVGLRYGDRSFGRLDVLCMMGVIVGLVLWQLLKTPAIGVGAAIIIDFVGFVPTFRHAWEKPHEETASTFALVGAGGVLAAGAIAATGVITVTSIGYPLYVAVSMTACALVTLLRRRRRLVGDVPLPADEPSEA